MSMKKTHDIVATVGTYKDQQGNEKKRYVNVGAMFTDSETGNMSIKLETIPVSPEWSGWLACYPPKDSQGQGNQSQPQARQQQPRPQAAPPAQAGFDDMDDVPF